MAKSKITTREVVNTKKLASRTMLDFYDLVRALEPTRFVKTKIRFFGNGNDGQIRDVVGIGSDSKASEVDIYEPEMIKIRGLIDCVLYGMLEDHNYSYVQGAAGYGDLEIDVARARWSLTFRRSQGDEPVKVSKFGMWPADITGEDFDWETLLSAGTVTVSDLKHILLNGTKDERIRVIRLLPDALVKFGQQKTKTKPGLVGRR